MNVDLKQMTGLMNLDDNQDVMPPFHHKYLMNGRFRGAKEGGLRVESIPGNVLIPNYLLPVGTNECVGAFFDQVKQRILWANYNSNGRNGWYQYNIKTQSLSKIFLCFTDSATDILRFSRDFPIHSVSIVYRTDADGDLMYWTDNNIAQENHPRYLNLDTVSTLAPFTEDMINAGKNAPVRVFDATYTDDAGVPVNNLNKKLFQFAYAWGYESGFTSTISGWNKTPLPVNGYDPNNQNDPTKNNTIIVTVIGGPADYNKIYLYGRECEGTTYGDAFLIDVLDRDQYSINPNTSYLYYFRNDGVRTSADPKYTLLPFDYLPDYAETLETLNGNVIIYANTTDGYDAILREDVEVSITSANGNPNTPTLSFAYAGTNVFTLYIGSVITTGATYHVEFNYSSGAGGDASPKNINYVTLLGDTQATVAVSIAALLAGNNIAVDNLGAGYLRVRTSTGSGTITDVVTTVSVAGAIVANAAWLWGCQYRFGLVYFDARGKTNGVVSFLGASADTTDFAVNTPLFSTNSNVVQVPVISASIDHIPPEWAVRYQWVRTKNLTTNSFIHYVTNDYQDPGDGFLYICIQNLYYQNSQNTGFVPTYDFAKGDRVKVMAAYNSGTNFYTAYNIQLDFEILGTVQRTMTSPATTGTFLKVVKPSTVPSTAYSAKMFIQIYTPSLKVPNELDEYFEWGEEYEVYEYSPGVFYHAGQVSNQTPTQSATFSWMDGDVYVKERTWYLNVSSTATETAFMMDANYSDYFSSAVNSNGRSWPSGVNAKKITNGVQLAWGQKYLQDTDVNDLNRFYPEDIDVVDLSGGNIWKIVTMGRELDIFQSRKTGRIGVYNKNIQDSSGSNILVTTNSIVTPNNVYYHPGEYGVGEQPTTVVKGTNCIYFSDCVRGLQLRLADDGVTEISTLYKGQYTIKNYLTPYNKEYVRSNGSKSKILGYYDYFENEYHAILQEGTLSGEPSIPNRNFSFNEERNSYTGFYKFHPEWAISAEDLTYSWKNGQLYVHNDEGTDRRFYNEKFTTSIKLVFNDKEAIRKKYLALGYQSNEKWECANLTSFTTGENLDAIITSFINPQTKFRQSSQLKAVDIDADNTEGQITAAFLRDINSGSNPNLALLEGDYLLGWWLEAEFTYKGGGFSYFYNPYITWEQSNRNF